jgi:L-threonylcarbamoyladenylate synthase
VPAALKTLRLNPEDPRDLARAAEILRSNGTVAFPTETVYGLGANALSADAVEKIFAAKQRPHWDPLIVHIASRAQLPQFATNLPPMAEALMEAFWPGPLTLLLPRTEAIPAIVTAGRPLVGVRIPNHPVAQALLREAGIPIAAPSANTFGHTSPTTAAHVLADLDGRIDAVLDGGSADVGLESTVAEVRGDQVIVYRPGAITLPMIEKMTGIGTASFFIPESSRQAPVESLPSPGVGIRHYAPRAKLTLVEIPHFRFSGFADLLLPHIDQAIQTGQTVGIMLPDDWLSDSRPVLYPWGPWDDRQTLANRLYAGLRALDEVPVDLILCPVPNGGGIAEAIRDRLQKAAR